MTRYKVLFDFNKKKYIEEKKELFLKKQKLMKEKLKKQMIGARAVHLPDEVKRKFEKIKSSVERYEVYKILASVHESERIHLIQMYEDKKYIMESLGLTGVKVVEHSDEDVEQSGSEDN